ncbi:TrmJ/YjtD family RNA methyltransferase [Candidatus Woesearchaeota archaeon]|nr:TrmJ/YjtD family RNA methyltransferase [Candidatus Woesearchaeota archaeon]
MITLVLIESENSGNLGAIARSMKNFDLSRLILINPKTDHLNDEALGRAKHSKEILKKAIIKDYSYFTEQSKDSIFKDFDLIIGTTSVLGSDYNIPRLPLTPGKLAETLDFNKKTALVFGRDGSGLNNEEIRRCNLVVTIPSSKNYPALNISHAASIVFYELYKIHGKNKLNNHIALASAKEKEVILEKITNILDKLEFQTKEKKQTQKLVWKNIVNKGFLTKREAFALLGFLRKLEEVHRG